MADEADPSLVHQLQLRNRDAWARAYDRYAGDLFAFVAHLLSGNRAAAEELHQETWLAALAGIDAFDPSRGDFRAWLFGIARRQVAWHFRRLSRGRVEPAGTDSQEVDTRDEQAILPLDVLRLIERSDAVRAALVELGGDAREVLVGKYVEGQSVEELARRLDRSPKAIESLLSRARSKLRELLRWYFETEDVVKDTRP